MAQDTPERSSGPAAATPAAAESPQPPPAGRESPAAGRPRKLLYVTLPGCWGALIFSCLSFTPSLLPRGGLTQGVVWGITAAIGYGLGVVAAWIWRAFADRGPRPPRRWAWPLFFSGPRIGGFKKITGTGRGWYFTADFGFGL